MRGVEEAERSEIAWGAEGWFSLCASYTSRTLFCVYRVAHLYNGKSLFFP